MRTLHYAGCDFVTSDRVAEAFVDYLVTLPLNQPPERVTIPALRAGDEVVAEFVVTAFAPIVTTSSHEREVPLHGEDAAIEALRGKARRLDGVGLETP